MSKCIRTVLREFLRHIVEVNYEPTSPCDPTLEEFKELTRRACNLVRDVFTTEQAKRRLDEVVTAKEIFAEAYKIRPDRWDGCNHLARTSYLLGQLEDAAKWNEEAFDRIQSHGGEGFDPGALNVRYAQHYELEAEIALAKADYQGAKQGFLRALSIDPSVNNRLSLIRVYSMGGDIKGAVVQIEELECHPDFPMWVSEFLMRISDEADFARLRASRAWRGAGKSPDLRSRWETAAIDANARFRETLSRNNAWKPRLKRVLRYVAVVAIVVVLEGWLPNASFGMHGLSTPGSSAQGFTIRRTGTHKILSDLRPWGQGARKSKISPTTYRLNAGWRLRSQEWTAR